MTDDDPFADLGETLSDDADDRADAAPSHESTDSTADDSSADGRPAEASDRGTDPTTHAAFSYDDADQRPFYARPETIDEFDSWLNYELERDLHDRGYQNIVVREMTDALLRTVVEEDLLDAVAERFERARENAASE